MHEITSLTYDTGFLFQIGCSHEAHRHSTQRMRAFYLGQKGKLESGSYFVHVPMVYEKRIMYGLFNTLPIVSTAYELNQAVVILDFPSKISKNLKN